MPMYDKECSCGHKVNDVRCKFGDTTPCPKCGKEMQPLPAGGSFQLKGQGWYADGYSKQ